MTGSHWEGHMILSSRGLERSRGKLKTYLHYQSAYGYQNWHYGDLTFRATIHQVTSPFSHGGLARSREKLKALYLHFINGHDHQAW